MRNLYLLFSLTLLFIAGNPCTSQAAVNTTAYDVSTSAIKGSAAQQYVQHYMDSMVQNQRYFQTETVSYYLTRPQDRGNNTLDFYLLLALCLLLGVIKTLHPKYFNDVWRAFINPTLGSRQLKDIIEAASIPNLLMNLFSSVVLGTYVFYLITMNLDLRFTQLPGGLVVSLLIIGASLVYLFKHGFILFSGWAFNIRGITEQYNFNIFLVNKILGMALLPFIICFAFLNEQWDTPITICSVVVLSLLLANRYLRSWNIFSQFFMNSRFHFFMYLCAFEILPLAILIKLVLRIL